MPLMVLGLAVMGFAELFIDPVAMSQITRIDIPGVTGVLTGIYMLLSGAIANYLAGVIADQTSQSAFDASGAVNYAINAYVDVFEQITWGALACVGVVLLIWLYQSFKFKAARWPSNPDSRMPGSLRYRACITPFSRRLIGGKRCDSRLFVLHNRPRIIKHDSRFFRPPPRLVNRFSVDIA